MPKTVCDVRDVEVARAVRLSKTSIEQVAFKVPRVKVSSSAKVSCDLNTIVPSSDKFLNISNYLVYNNVKSSYLLDFGAERVLPG